MNYVYYIIADDKMVLAVDTEESARALSVNYDTERIDVYELQDDGVLFIEQLEL